MAVITTTIGRDTLEKTIISIQQQTYPCKHYVFVDGKQHWEKVKHLEQKYPHVVFTFLPMNTGGENNIGNGAIHAILPYILKEDIFCFLDDDNWYDTNHVAYLANMIDQYQLDYAYSLRKLYTTDYQFLCNDDFESLGYWFVPIEEPFKCADEILIYSNKNIAALIDTNCYAITRNIAFELSKEWYSGLGNDKNVFAKLIDLNAKGGCTAQRTLNYKVNFQIGGVNIPQHYIWDFIKEKCKQIAQEKQPWMTPTLYIDGVLQPIDENN
ncbi:glycosyltransferase family 2 protein [Canicola haemoglobinophilus]|uniref:glycosyltransferase family 2 protein n=1 Tax=Canicola haemoglobinophilus TaxID=733 RepID=UPI001558E062|nr:glycosyltransferase [Canicola haemoglobinophilus]